MEDHGWKYNILKEHVLALSMLDSDEEKRAYLSKHGYSTDGLIDLAIADYNKLVKSMDFKKEFGPLQAEHFEILDAMQSKENMKEYLLRHGYGDVQADQAIDHYLDMVSKPAPKFDKKPTSELKFD